MREEERRDLRPAEWAIIALVARGVHTAPALAAALAGGDTSGAARELVERRLAALELDGFLSRSGRLSVRGPDGRAETLERWGLSSDGSRAWEEAIRAPRMRQPRLAAWVEEALTGITPAGERSGIDRAVLVSAKGRRGPVVESLANAASRAGVGPDEFLDRVAHGDIVRCPRCEREGRPQWHRAEEMSGGWCRECRRDYARARRAARREEK